MIIEPIILNVKYTFVLKHSIMLCMHFFKLQLKIFTHVIFKTI